MGAGYNQMNDLVVLQTAQVKICNDCQSRELAIIY